MGGLQFEDQPQLVVSDPNRADVACFVGYVARRDTKLPLHIGRWLYERRWLTAADATTTLLQLPTPIDTWEIFDLLFAWEQRPLGSSGVAPTYLGAAVRSFFAQGGRKCYVIRVGDPWDYLATPADRITAMQTRLNNLLPDYISGVIGGTPVEPASWRGAGHLFGLTDVSFLCLPDLADIVRNPVLKIDPEDKTPPPKESFVECSDPLPAPPVHRSVGRINAPRCDEQGYQEWSRAIGSCARFLYAFQSEVQLVAALPLPEKGAAAEENLLAYLHTLPGQPLARSPKPPDSGMASAFVQLTYPWVRTSSSVNLPEGLESPDGVLTGMLARNALARGAFRSAANLAPVAVQELTPALRHEQIERLGERISLFTLTPDGLRLFSDVTTSLQRSYRQAHVNRLMAALTRATRRLGEDLLFEAAGERLWAQVRNRLRTLLEGFRTAGALRGESAAEAYFVRCDRSIMTQNDIDNSRVIAHVQIDPAAAIDSITVVLALDEGGHVSVVGQR